MNKSTTTILAFDYGLRQIGVATGNTLLGTTQALSILRARDGVPVWEDVQRLLQEWQPDLLLVGDPLHMDGSVSSSADKARKFARRLHGRFGLAVEMVDERLTSFAAKQNLNEVGHRGDYKAQPADSEAARLILESWLAQQGSG